MNGRGKKRRHVSSKDVSSDYKVYNRAFNTLLSTTVMLLNQSDNKKRHIFVYSNRNFNICVQRYNLIKYDTKGKVLVDENNNYIQVYDCDKKTLDTCNLFTLQFDCGSTSAVKIKNRLLDRLYDMLKDVEFEKYIVV